jgi:hypothetical protein
VQEIRTPGSAWGDERKTPRLLGETPARKSTGCEAPHGLPLVEARLYHQPWNVKLPAPVESAAREAARASTEQSPTFTP